MRNFLAAAFIVAAALAIANGFFAQSARGQEIAVDPHQEYNVKAVYLYSFGRYVAWPKAASRDENADFVIGILGEDPFGTALEQIAQLKKIQGRTITVRRFNAPEEYRPCRILYIARSVPAEQQSAILERLRNKPVLLVGETPGFAAAGGTIGFFMHGDTVRFEINGEAAKRQRLEIDARLLSLARTVRGN